MNNTVVVTGAAGFIGSHLCEALLRSGHRVIGIDNFDQFYSRAAKLMNIARIETACLGTSGGRSAFQFVESDIREAPIIQSTFVNAQPQAVFHLAALAGVRPSIEDPVRYSSVNIDGLMSVLEAARSVCSKGGADAHARCSIIFASSSSVYGNNKKVPFAETDPVDEPISPYAATKRAGELLCHTYAHLFNMRIAALRFFTVYGPAQRPDLAISKFMRLIAAGEEVPMFGDGQTSRDYTYIDDIIQGILAAYEVLRNVETSKRPNVHTQHAHNGSGFRIYNLGGSQPITLAEMIDTIASVVCKPARIKRLPMQPGDVERTWADLTRSGKELKFLPRTPFADGIRQQWMQSQAL